MAVPFTNRKHMFSQLSSSVRRFSNRKTVNVSNKTAVKKGMSFQEMCARRKQEASRSILVQVPSRKHIANLYHQIGQSKSIRHIFHFSHIKDYVLLEMESELEVQRILSTATHFTNTEKIPVESRVLLLTPSDWPVKQNLPVPIYSHIQDQFNMTDCSKANSVSAQIEYLYECNRLSDLGSRLRFFVCSNLEDMLSGLFPQCSVLPFGSTVNGFGKHDCDLDMTLTLLPDDQQTGRNTNLKFMTKKRTDNERGFVQRSLQTVADIVEQFIPLCWGVQRILNARVPIVKFRHEACNIECDLSFSHLSGFKMSEILWNWSQMDSRVCPLVFCIRHWARINEITRKHPGAWLSNFILTILVVFFLQNLPNKLLPSLSGVAALGKINTSVNTISKKNHQSLGDLLREFFVFYSSFDFHSYGLSVLHASTFSKPDFSPVYIENPLDGSHNISQNININELEKFKKACETALWNLEARENKERNIWGIMNILTPNESLNSTKIHVTVGELFTEDSPAIQTTDTINTSDKKS